MSKIYTIISVIFLFSLLGRQAWDLGRGVLGRELFLLFVLFGGLFFSYRLLGLSASIAFGGLLALLYPFLVPEELIHIFLFGSFGYFVFLNRVNYKFLWISGISVGDELFQWILPWRVCDPRDMVLNLVSCLVGGLVCVLQSRNASFFGTWGSGRKA